MVSKKDSNKARLQRHKRVRGKISGTEACPRLCVYRSLKNIYAQIAHIVLLVFHKHLVVVQQQRAPHRAAVEPAGVGLDRSRL